jgi:hypothetical protein
MSSVRRLALVGAVALSAAALAVAEGTTIPTGTSDNGAPTYTNARIVAVDVTGRTLMIRNTKGVEETVELDDNLAGFGDIRAGDLVILTLRTGPGRARVSSIVKSTAAPAPKVAASHLSSPPMAPVDNSEEIASREAFGAQVVRLAGQADRVEHVWDGFRSACAFRAGNLHEGARGWFVIWEGSISADLSGGFCRDLFNQIIDLGEPIKVGMTAAEDVARRTLSPGDIREIRRQYTMDWDGWGLTPPKKLER